METLASQRYQSLQYDRWISQSSRSAAFIVSIIWIVFTTILTDQGSIDSKLVFLLVPFILVVNMTNQQMVTCLFVNVLLFVKGLRYRCYQMSEAQPQCVSHTSLQVLLSEMLVCVLPVVCTRAAVIASVTLEVHFKVLETLHKSSSTFGVSIRLLAVAALVVSKYWSETRMRLLFSAAQQYSVNNEMSTAKISSRAIEMLGRAVSDLESLTVLPLARSSVHLIERSLHLLLDNDCSLETTKDVDTDVQAVIDLHSGQRTMRHIYHLLSSTRSMSSQSEYRPSPTSSVRPDSLNDFGGLLDPVMQTERMDTFELRQELASRAGQVYCEFALLETFKELTEERGGHHIECSELRALSNELTLSEQWEVPELSECQHDFKPLLIVGFQYLIPFIDEASLNVSEDILCNFLWYLENMYIDNPYHNAHHGAQVMHAATWLAKTILAHEFSVRDKIGLAVASLAHDAGHPARTNGFLCAISSPLAVLYNDISVLENYHCSLLFNILALEECNIFAGSEREDLFYFRRFAIRVILATDMRRHFELLTESKMKLDPKTTGSRQREERDEESRLFLFCLIIKAADLSHTAISWQSHEEWSSRVQQEFFLQGDFERANGIPISPLCDRHGISKREYAKSQNPLLAHFGAQ